MSLSAILCFRKCRTASISNPGVTKASGSWSKVIELELHVVDPSSRRTLLLHVPSPKELGPVVPLYRSVVMVPDPRLDGFYRDAADQILESLMDFNPVD
ncbi:glutathione synthase [Ancistrocladus abbreviatus]